jgi:hypothetical protein
MGAGNGEKRLADPGFHNHLSLSQILLRLGHAIKLATEAGAGSLGSRLPIEDEP